MLVEQQQHLDLTGRELLGDLVRDASHPAAFTDTVEQAGLLAFSDPGHIDPDLFDIFVREKVYLQYAQQFLDPEQIDEVDLSKIPGVPEDLLA